ncbi:MAG: hypothetical protein Q8N88_04615 [Nanoarchaeota archaeon]|nr:hypothetical protein [Nanoarchaeota archaeon]
MKYTEEMEEIKPNVKLFDLDSLKMLLIPGSFISAVGKFERKFGKMTNIIYLPVIMTETLRVAAYYEFLIKPVYNLVR